jgi:hypothetical protein
MSQGDWDPEKWVWEQICVGKIADFGDRLGALEPPTSDGWKRNRQLSATFLRKIFYDKTFLDKIPLEGVRAGAPPWTIAANVVA